MNYRENGAMGALLDEYEKSIQTILTHVVQSGFWYVDEIRKFEGEKLKFPKPKEFETISAYKSALDKMFKYNVRFFNDYPDLNLEEKDNSKKIVVLWKQMYNVEQLFEHAIVHILRHRRQIERFILKLKK